MAIFYSIYVIFTVILFATIHCDKSIEDDIRICKELCESCNGIESYVNDICECQIDHNNLKLIECIDDIKIKAAEKNLTLINIQPKILGRSTRCCPTQGRIRIGDILRVVDYYMKGGSQTGTRILENHRRLDDNLIDPVDCQYCPDDNEYPNNDFAMPEDESIVYESPTYPSIHTTCEEQTHYPVQNSYSRNDYNIPNIPNYHQIQSPINYHRPLSDLTLFHHHSHDQIPPHISPTHQYNPYYKSIESPLTHLSKFNYPQYSSGRIPYYNYEKSKTRELCCNHIENPPVLCPPIMQSRRSRMRSCQQCQLEVPRRREPPIVQPSYTLSTTMWPIRRQQSIIKSKPWQHAPRRESIPIRNQQSMAYTDFVTDINYTEEPFLGAANPNADDSNNDNDNDNNGRDILDIRDQQIVIENRDSNRNSMSSIRSDVTIKPNPSTMSSQTQTTPTHENSLLINIPNTMKRTIPALLRYRKIRR